MSNTFMTICIPDDVLVKQAEQLHDGRWFVLVRRRYWSVYVGDVNYHSGLGAHADTLQEALDKAVASLPLADQQIADKKAAALQAEATLKSAGHRFTVDEAAMDDLLKDLGL